MEPWRWGGWEAEGALEAGPLQAVRGAGGAGQEGLEAG